MCVFVLILLLLGVCDCSQVVNLDLQILSVVLLRCLSYSWWCQLVSSDNVVHFVVVDLLLLYDLQCLGSLSLLLCLPIVL